MSEFSGRCSVQRLQALYETRSESNTTDFTIVCQDGGVIPVHSFILSMGSDVLATTVSGAFKEKEIKRIEMKSYTSRAVQQFVRFLYGLELEEKELDLASKLDIIIMGGVYNMPSVQTAATFLLSKHINTDNMVDMLEFAKTHNASAATEVCNEFIMKNIDELLPEAKETLSKKPDSPVEKLKENRGRNILKVHSQYDPWMMHYKKNKAITHEIEMDYDDESGQDNINVIFTGLGLSLLPGSEVEVTVKNGGRELFNDVLVNDSVNNIVPIKFKENVAPGSIGRFKFSVTMKGFGAMYPFLVRRELGDWEWRVVKAKGTNGEPIGEVTFRIYDGQIPELYFYVEKKE